MQILETLTGIVIMVFTYLKQTIIMAFTNLKQTIIMLFTFLKQTIIMVFDYLRETLTSWVAECKSRTNSNKHLKYSVYTPNNDSADDYCDAMSHFQEFKFESGKSFSNVFYPEKDDVVKRLDFFSKNKEWYKKRGIPYTMELLGSWV